MLIWAQKIQIVDQSFFEEIVVKLKIQTKFVSKCDALPII